MDKTAILERITPHFRVRGTFKNCFNDIPYVDLIIEGEVDVIDHIIAAKICNKLQVHVCVCVRVIMVSSDGKRTVMDIVIVKLTGSFMKDI